MSMRDDLKAAFRSLRSSKDATLGGGVPAAGARGIGGQRDSRASRRQRGSDGRAEG